MAATQDNSEFLDDLRLERIGSVNGVLLCDGGYWIHRRKESVKVIDETAVQRTVSVDFTLPEKLDGRDFDTVIQLPAGGEPVYCPPLFVLPKSSNELMSFDLRSESGVSLPLMTRRDNARVSATTLIALGERVLNEPLSDTLERRLEELAIAETVRPVAAERLMQAGEDDPDLKQLQPLCMHPVFRWWLWTLAHSSLVGVPFRDPTVRRKIFVLSYIESFVHSLRVRTRLGWAPYKVVIDSSWIGARNFHFEAEAPPGLRIAKAILAEDDEDDENPGRRASSDSLVADDDGPPFRSDEVPSLGREGASMGPPITTSPAREENSRLQEEAWASGENTDPAFSGAETSVPEDAGCGSSPIDLARSAGAESQHDVDQIGSDPMSEIAHERDCQLETVGVPSSAGSSESRNVSRALWNDDDTGLISDVGIGKTSEDSQIKPAGRVAKDDPDREVNGLLRRVHLSRYEASRAGASTATLDLRVNGPDFIGGALLACGLVVAAVAGCLIRSESIAKNPTSAPSVLLLLPGMIATYVGRPDRHALTTRLLLFARWLLLLAGLAAYGCAAFVALGSGSPKTPAEVDARVTHLKLVFWCGTGLAVTCFAGLALGWLLANPTIRKVLAAVVYFRWVTKAGRVLKRSHFVHSLALPLSSHALTRELKTKGDDLLNLKRKRRKPAPPDSCEGLVVVDELAVFRMNQASTWALRLQVAEVDGEVELRLCGKCLPRLLFWPIRPLLVSREARAAGRRLKKYGQSLKPTLPQAHGRFARWRMLMRRT